MDRWKAGTLDLHDEREMKGRINVLTELGETDFDEIHTFYQQTGALGETPEEHDEEEDKDAAEAIEDAIR